MEEAATELLAETAETAETAEITEIIDIPDIIHVFTVSTRVEEQACDSRIEAVQLAKDWSLDDQQVNVERDDGQVHMTFRDGSLVEYVFETRPGRRS